MGVPPHRRDPIIEAYRAGVDRTLLRENLKLTPEQRVLKLMELQRLAEEARRAGAAVRDAARQRGPSRRGPSPSGPPQGGPSRSGPSRT